MHFRLATADIIKSPVVGNALWISTWSTTIRSDSI